MTTHSRILAWRIPWTEEPEGLQSMGCREWDMTEHVHVCVHVCTHTHTHTHRDQSKVIPFNCLCRDLFSNKVTFAGSGWSLL